ncbi:MAG: YggT family protein [Chloroflexi bacterium]|nr:MAG: YggT family protein [Chloroflexota bacterium]RLC96438.1 MAG: YggT family protein [Chloroflexota bacterium]
MEYAIRIVDILCNVLIWAIFVRVLLSWLNIRPDSPFYPVLDVLDQILEPLLAPLRRVVPRVGMFDITPMVAMFILYLISRLIYLIPTDAI